MSGPGRTVRRRRTSPWLVHHRLRRAVRWSVAAGLGLVLLSILIPARTGVGGATQRSTQEVEPWRRWRERLTEAHAARRVGDLQGALEGYDAVASADRARGQDADRAALWAARLRLGLGECSAALALRAVVMRSQDPALLARTVVEAESHAIGARCAAWSSTLRAAAALAREKLNALAAQETGEGERARRWLRSAGVTRR